VESTTKWCVESEGVDRICALMSCSACSLSSEKVLTPQQFGTDVSAACHHALVIMSPVMLRPTPPLSRGLYRATRKPR
jgi:hypothetical protein